MREVDVRITVKEAVHVVCRCPEDCFFVVAKMLANDGGVGAKNSEVIVNCNIPVVITRVAFGCFLNVAKPGIAKLMVWPITPEYSMTSIS